LEAMGFEHRISRNRADKNMSSIQKKPSFIKRIKYLFKSNDTSTEDNLYVSESNSMDSPELPSGFFLTDEERGYFPKLASELDVQASLYSEKLGEYKQASAYEEELRHRKTEYFDRIESRIRQLAELKKSLSLTEKKHQLIFMEEKEKIRLILETELIDIHDGFNLAMLSPGEQDAPSKPLGPKGKPTAPLMPKNPEVKL
ncbi:MAG: hypothetical protein AAFY41_18875, partial [Bacteroidota bacterium]